MTLYNMTDKWTEFDTPYFHGYRFQAFATWRWSKTKLAIFGGPV